MNDLISQWEWLMKSFPSDGWDGAGNAIARHDQQVVELERQLDIKFPDWRESGLRYPPRTVAPLKEYQG